jgi:hypothetical protein
MSDTELFAFEQDFVATLRCIPMAVRLKLDVSGIKLSLRQWSRFTVGDRRALLQVPCRRLGEVAAYRAALVDLVVQRAHELAKPLAETPCGQWDERSHLPTRVVEFAAGLGLRAPTIRQWAGLTRLQRFTLIKLTRDSHDNVNFAPAMREFGLLAGGVAREELTPASAWAAQLRPLDAEVRPRS